MPALPDPLNEDVSTVLVGSLNPAIFQPAWLAAQGLILESEAKAAKINVISPQASDVTFLDFGLQVLQSRLTLRTIDISKSDKICDLVVGILTKLSHTPITAAGINQSFHLPTPGEGVWHHIGHVLAPKDRVWNTLYENPGMLSLTIQSPRKNPFSFNVNVSVQPSQLTTHGVFFSSNFDFKTSNKIDSAAEAADFLQGNWEEGTKEARRVAEAVFKEIVWRET